MTEKMKQQECGKRKPRPGGPAPSFSGHETFVFRYAWLKKAVDAIRKDHLVFTADQAMVTLGVGKNMVRSMRHWSLATGIVEEVPQTRGASLRTTALGELLFGDQGRDPYFEDLNTLWLLHWKLATNGTRCTTWSWACSLYPGAEFSRDGLMTFIADEAFRRYGEAPNENSLKRDVDCFLRTYLASRPAKDNLLEDTLDCPLTELGFLEQDSASTVRFRRGNKTSLSDETFVFCLLDYWTRNNLKETAAFSEIAYGYGSPGMVFKLDENGLSDRLERLEAVTDGVLAYTETAGLKQVYRRSNSDPMKYLAVHYDNLVHSTFAGVAI